MPKYRQDMMRGQSAHKMHAAPGSRGDFARKSRPKRGRKPLMVADVQFLESLEPPVLRKVEAITPAGNVIVDPFFEIDAALKSSTSRREPPERRISELALRTGLTQINAALERPEAYGLRESDCHVLGIIGGKLFDELTRRGLV